MKFLLIIILASSFAWSFSREATQPERRLVAACPGIETVNHPSRDIWRTMRGTDKAAEFLLRDYHKVGRNAFGIIRTM
jgi:uncharacterized protein (DUF2336 family)